MMKQANAILTFFFNLKYVATVRPALVWIRGLMLFGQLRILMKSQTKAKVFYQYAYGMIQALEVESPDAAKDLLEPLGKYKSEIAKVLSIPVSGFTLNGIETQEGDAPALSRSNSKSKLKKQSSLTKTDSGVFEGGAPLKRTQSLRSERSEDSKKNGKCTVM